MLISRWFLSFVFLLVQSAICSVLSQGESSINEKTPKQLQGESESYGYNHPPLSELNEQKGLRKAKSIVLNEQNSSSLKRPLSRSTRRRTRPKADTSSLEIPVQVIYDKEPTTVLSSRRQTTTTTTSPLDRTTRVVIKKKLLQSNNSSKKIDIRQIQNIDTNNVTKNVQTSTGIENNSSAIEFPTRSRESYFKKRTEIPAPKVKIIEEKNFVYGYRGNFHYSYLGGDGTMISSEGLLKSFDNNKTGEAVSGSVYYKDEEGNDFSLTYTADENGYRPSGAHLPTPPPIPPAIARALKYVADKSTVSPLAKTE